MSKRPYLIAAALLLLASIPAEARQCAPGQKRIKLSDRAYGCVSAAAQKPAPRKQKCVGKPGPGGSVKLVCT